MLMKKAVSLVLVCILLIGYTGYFCIDVNAVEVSPSFDGFIDTRASGQFDTSVSADSVKRTGNQFQMLPGETVSIIASYSPSSADVDFGLLDSDGVFYYVSAQDGSIDTSIEVSERGTYSFAIRNNSSKTINVSGYVNY